MLFAHLLLQDWWCEGQKLHADNTWSMLFGCTACTDYRRQYLVVTLSRLQWQALCLQLLLYTLAMLRM